jgi:hypothetical protein
VKEESEATCQLSSAIPWEVLLFQLPRSHCAFFISENERGGAVLFSVSLFLLLQELAKQITDKKRRRDNCFMIVFND